MPKKLKQFFLIVVGVLFVASAVNLFMAPHSIAAGGLTGLAIILERVMGLDRALIVMVANAFLVCLTYLFLGKEVFLKTVLGAFLLPLFMKVIPHKMLIHDMLLSNIFGSICFGVGISILYSQKSSTGGTSIPPLILQKFYGIDTSVGLLVTDSLIVLGSLFVFGVEPFFHATFAIFLASGTMRYLETGLNRKRLLQIISKESEPILQALLVELDTGVTVVPAMGGYTREPRNVLMVAINDRDYFDAKKIVDRLDKEAFVIVHNVADIHGKGFTYNSTGA